MSTGLIINPKTNKPFTKQLKNEIVTRQIATGDFMGWFSELPDPDPILKKLNCDLTVYEDLMADYQVGCNVVRLKNSVKSKEWIIKPGEASEKEVELCELVIKSLEKNKFKTKDIISQSLNPHLWGMSVFECVWDKIGQYWLPIRLQEKPIEWFKFDSENNLKFITNTDPEGIFITGRNAHPSFRHRFFILRNEPTYKNPWGDRALSRCFWAVVFKRGGFKFLSTFVEKFGMPHVVAKHQPNISHEDKMALMSDASRMIQDAVAVIPQGNDVEIHRTGEKQSGEIYKMFIDMCDAQIDKATLLSTFATSQQEKGGYSTATAGGDIVESLGNQLQDYPEELYRELFSSAVELNIGSGLVPEYSIFEEDDSKKEFADRDNTLSDAAQKSGQRIKRTKNFYINNYGYKEDEFEIEESADTNNPPVPTTEFSESTTSNQQTVASPESLTNALSDKLLQSQINTVLKPVLELINNASEFSEVEEALTKIYPDLDSSAIEKTLTRLYFLADTLGRLDIENEK